MPPTSSSPHRQVDVCVVGGGPAALPAALVLARSRRSVLVSDAGEPRNPYGWEVRDRVIGVLATSLLSLHQAGLFRQLSDRVSVLAHTGPTPDADQAATLAARDIEVVEGEVVALEVDDDVLGGVRLADGRRVARDVLAVAPRFVARSGLLAALGVDTVDHPSGAGAHVPADAMGATKIAGVWVAGNVTDPSAQVITAAAQGNRAGAAVNADLVAEDAAYARDGA
ncbi:MAG: hypothetical protein KY462_00025 [Actinobacteria bacterium]|nr:hypothetical protein [Actinomycetota bacterium]